MTNYNKLILNIVRVIKGISKSDAVNLLQNADFTKERGVL